MSIVHDEAGVTRDIISAEIGHNINLMDTGGIGFAEHPDRSEISVAVGEQVDFAIRAADLILFVVDGSTGVTPLDIDIAQTLRKASKNVIIVANKIDKQTMLNKIYEFSELGFKNIIGVSAEHGLGESELRDKIEYFTKEFSATIDKEAEQQTKIKICFLGRPNVGKSSTVNALLKEKRLVVSKIPGTTRDSVCVDLEYHKPNGATHMLQLIDTAGVKSVNKVNNSIDFYSQCRTKNSMKDADIVFLLLDAVEGVTRMDKKLSGDILSAGKGLIVLVNKWDIATKEFSDNTIPGYASIEEFKKHFEESVQKELFALPGIPVLFTSALKNLSTEKILESAVMLHTRMSQKIKTSELNSVVQDALEARHPAIDSGKRFRIYYCVQTQNYPFKFKMFCNRLERLEQSYKRYLEKCMRNSLDLAGCPMEFEWSEKERRYNLSEEE